MEMLEEESNGETNEGLESGDNHEGMGDETSYTPEVTEQEYTPEPTSDSDSDASDPEVPYMEGDSETAPDSNSVDVTPDCLAGATLNGMGWMWTNNVHLFLNSWRQAMIAVTNATDVPPDETYIPNIPPAVDMGVSGTEPEPGP